MEFVKKNLLPLAVSLSLFVMIGFIFWFLGGTETLTQRENILFGFLLTIFSILVSWIISHVYSKEFYQSSLKTYGLNAAEKVNNLSEQLNYLSLYLQNFQDDISSKKINNDTIRYEERIEGTIHIINTLKSVNDTSLSDWEGVIGSELKEKREQKEEAVDEVKEVVDKFEDTMAVLQNTNSAESLRDEINSLQKNFKYILRSVSESPVPIKQRNKRQEVRVNCPKCNSSLTFKQKPKLSSYKGVECGNCGSKFIAKWDEVKGAYLESRENKHEAFECPICHKPQECDLDSFIGTKITVKCSSCGNDIKISRSKVGLNVGGSGASPTQKQDVEISPLSEEMISLVKSNLPLQPWPKGTHLKLSENLNIAVPIVKAAMHELVERGDFYFQRDGKLYKEIK